MSFSTFGIPEELATDGGPEFTSGATQRFLKDWGVHHRLSSVAFPHSNCRAEIGVKSIKRLLSANLDASGRLNTDKVHLALPAFRNTPDPTTKMSPAQVIFGHQLRGPVPTLQGKYLPSPTWQADNAHREATLRHRHAKTLETWTEHSRGLHPLSIGNHVLVQNQSGPFPTKWDKTGVVVETLPYLQYRIRIDGVGRSTLRNRRFLRLFTPHTPTLPPETRLHHPHGQPAIPPAPFDPPVPIQVPAHPAPAVLDPPTMRTQPPPATPLQREPPSTPPTPTPDARPTRGSSPPPTPRRSSRATAVPTWHADYQMAVYTGE